MSRHAVTPESSGSAQADGASSYEEMPRDWQRALAVVAHPDDIEYGLAGAVARWTDEGREIAYLLVTRGEAGIDSMYPEQAAAVRSEEQRASAALVGVHDVEFLDHPDGLIEYGVPLRRDIAAAIRRYRPEMVLSGNHHPVWPGGGFNTADHRHVGQAVLDAANDAGNRWLFPDVGPAPWAGVRYVALASSPSSTHAVEVGATLDRAIASLQAHAAYLDALGDHPMADAETTLRGMAEDTGARFGGRLASAFELFQM